MEMTVKELYEKVQSGEIVSDIELQREIVYNAEKQMLVIDSLVIGVPLPAFYLWQNENGIYEVLDGKQRIEAICNFLNNDLEYNGKNRKNTDIEIQNKILNNKLSIIVSSGDEQLKREIFNRINTLGVALSNFETLNGLYAGIYLEGLTDYCRQGNVQKCFGQNSRGNNQYKLLQYIILRDYKKFKKNYLYDYVQNHINDDFSIDQKYIEDRLKFIKDVFDSPKSHIDTYWYLADKYLKDKSVWVKYRKDINLRLNEYYKSTDYKLSSNKQNDIEDICRGSVSGLTLDSKRTFTQEQKSEYISKFAVKQDNKCQCAECKKIFDTGAITEAATYFFEDELEMDHIIPWSKGGKTELSNVQLLCKVCNIKKSNKILDK